MNNEIQQRLVWIKLIESTKDAGLVCRRCGISRPTLRKWWLRFQETGEQGLVSESKRPHSSPNVKVTVEIEHIILGLRTARNLGDRRLQSELSRLHNIKLSLATIYKVLKRNDVKEVVKFR
jgi:transposase-like protein